MRNVQAAARPKSLSAGIAILLSAALALFGMASPVRAVGPDSLGELALPERPLGIAVNSAGDRYVTQQYEETVLVFPNGSTSTDPARTLTGIVGEASSIAFDSTGRAFVSSPGASKIYVFEVGSTTPNETALTGDPDDFDNPMAAPFGLAFDASDNLFVANTATNDDAVYVFTPEGSLPDSSKKIDDAVLSNPQAVAVNAAGDVYIGGSGLGAGVWVAPAGSNSIDLEQTRPSLTDVRGLGFNAADELYASDGTSIMVFATDATTPSAARTLTGIGQVQGLAIAPDSVTDPEGTVYVADYTGRRVLRFSPEPVLAVDKADVNFGEVLKDTTASQTITITNSAGADLIMDAAPFVIAGSNPNRFAVTATTCASAVLVRNVDSCTVQVVFSSTARGERSAVLQIASSAPETPYLVPLTGKGIAPVFNSNPARHSYGAIPVDGPAATRQYTITNDGDAPLVLPVSSVAIVGANPEPFTITENSCSDSSVDPTQSCTVTVDFDPTESGPRVANLQFIPNAPEVTRTIELTGAGTVPGFAASESSKEFTTTVGTESAEALFTVTSTGNQALEFDGAGVNLAGADNTDFAITSDTCSGELVASGQTCEVGVAFAPGTVGTKNANVTFTNNAPDSPQAITLRGYSLPTSPAVSLSEDRKDFPDFTIGTAPTTHTFTVTNSGTAPLTVGSTPVTGADAADFTVLPSSTCAESSVAIGNSCTVVVTFAPEGTGDKLANLQINSNAPEIQHTLPLTGSAISLAAAPGKPSAASGANGQAALSWPAPAADGNRTVTGYRVTVSTNPSSGFTNAGGSCASSGTNTARSCTVTGLASGTAYYFKVAAINAVGTSEFSTASSAVTPPAPPVTPPSTSPVTQAQRLSKCTLASTLKKRGGTKLQKGACLTNAGQRVTISLKLKGKGKKSAKVKQSATKIKIKGKGDALKVILTLTAPAMPGFTAYSSKVTYKAK